MNNKKSTKRALTSSVLSLVLCMAMLIGTTFAWFTDNASTSVNTIQSGKLDIALEYSTDDGATWLNAEGQTLNFMAADNRSTILWEPGCTYELPLIRVRNNGNLALKYELNINGVTGDAKLLEAIDFTANGDAISEFSGTLLTKDAVSETILIKGHMKENATNEYQDLSITGIGITVSAIQYTHENDSYNDQYDVKATYLNQDEDGNWLISTADEFRYFALSVNSGTNYANETVLLTADIDLENVNWKPINGFKGTFDGQKHTISNLRISGVSKVGLFGQNGTGPSPQVKNFTVDGATVSGNHHVAVVVGNTYGTISDISVKNATVTCTSIDEDNDGDKCGAIVGLLGEDATVKGCTVDNVTIIAKRDVGGVVGATSGYLENNAIKNSRIFYEDKNAGEIFSTRLKPKKNENNTFEDVTVEQLQSVDNATELSTAVNDKAAVSLAAGTYNTNFKIDGGQDTIIVGNGKDTILNGQIATTASNEGTLVLRNLTINVSDAINDSTGISQTSKSAIAIWGDQTVICENVTFNMNLEDSTAITSWWDTGIGTSIIVRNCTFNCNGQRPIRATGNVTVENCTFNDPYRYAVQLTAKTSTATQMGKAIINFRNNTIVNGANGKDFVYGIQFEGEEYGCRECEINGSGNKIVDGGTGSAMYYCECGKVEHGTMTFNTEVPVVHAQ